MTVTEPFHLVPAALSELEYTPIEYQKFTRAYAEEVLGVVSAAAKSAGVDCETLHSEHEHVYQAIIDAAASRGCDLIVMALAGASRCLGGCPRQRDCQGAHTLEDPGPRLPLRSSG